jgi:hypothetical protein
VTKNTDFKVFHLIFTALTSLRIILNKLKITSGIKASVGARATVKKAIGFSELSIEEKGSLEAVKDAEK